MDHSTDIVRELRRIRARIENEGLASSNEEMAALIAAVEALAAEFEHERAETRRSLRWFARSQRNLDSRLLPVEYSLIFRTLRRIGGLFQNWRSRAGRMLLGSRLHPLYLRLAPPRGADPYQLWIGREALATPPAESLRSRAEQFGRRPLFSIVLPVHNPRREWLEAALDSVRAQSYSRWELCVCDDASNESWAADYFQKLAGELPVRFVRSAERLGISGALNRAAALARGEYVGFLDQDDVLSPAALYHVAETLQESEADLIYSDEDLLDAAGRREHPVFKPGWSPDLLTGCMYFGHFLVVSKRAFDSAGGFRSEYDGSQDYDLALRITDKPVAVKHVPRILYHWRQHEGSTAGKPAEKPYAHEAGRRALEAAVERRGWNASVEDGPSSTTYRVRRQVRGRPPASIVICSRNPGLLQRALGEIENATSYEPREIVVVQHRMENQAAMDEFLKTVRATVVAYEGPFNFAAMNNQGARAAKGDILVFFNDDVAPLAPEWLERLVAHAQRPEVGAAGAKLLYPSGALQHAGIAVGIGDGAGHPHRGRYDSPYWHWDEMTRNVSAVTGACLAMRRTVFEQLGGFDEQYPVNYNDVDLCLRAREAGYQVIYEPLALLRHCEAQTRIAFTRYEERERLYRRWCQVIEGGDPFYNPNLTRLTEDATLRIED